MPAPLPKPLLEGTQDVINMLEWASTAPAFSSSAMDSTSLVLIGVERTGKDSEGNLVKESARREGDQFVDLEGNGDKPTKVRKDIQAKCLIRMRVTEKMENSLGNMHGGCGATLVDNLTSMVLYLHTSGIPGSSWSFLGVSQNINVYYHNACPIGSVVEIEITSEQVGKSIASLKCDIFLISKEGGEDDGSLPIGDDWKRIRKTLSGMHTKVDNSATVKL